MCESNGRIRNDKDKRNIIAGSDGYKDVTKLEFIIILVAIFLVLIGTLGHMMNYTHSYNYTNLRIIDCQDMYNNQTVMEMCYDKWGPEIDP